MKAILTKDIRIGEYLLREGARLQAVSLDGIGEKAKLLCEFNGDHIYLDRTEYVLEEPDMEQRRFELFKTVLPMMMNPLRAEESIKEALNFAELAAIKYEEERDQSFYNLFELE